MTTPISEPARLMAAVCCDECSVYDPVEGSVDSSTFKRKWELKLSEEHVPCLLQTTAVAVQVQDGGRLLEQQTVLKTPMSAPLVKTGQVVEITRSDVADIVGTRWLVNAVPASGWVFIRRYGVEAWRP